MKQHREWERLPTEWILKGEGLTQFAGARGSSVDAAALMLLIAITHNVVSEEGHAQLLPGQANPTYTELMLATGLSKASISSGIQMLIERGLLKRQKDGRNNIFTLANYGVEKSSWGKLPAKKLYTADQKRIRAFQDFTMRSPVELYALKLYLLLVALRDNELNVAHVGNEKINLYTGIPFGRLKETRTRLLLEHLVWTEAADREDAELGVSYRYRLIGISPKMHAGTVGRRDRTETISLNTLDLIDR